MSAQTVEKLTSRKVDTYLDAFFISNAKRIMMKKRFEVGQYPSAKYLRRVSILANTLLQEECNLEGEKYKINELITRFINKHV